MLWSGLELSVDTWKFFLARGDDRVQRDREGLAHNDRGAIGFKASRLQGFRASRLQGAETSKEARGTRSLEAFHNDAQLTAVHDPTKWRRFEPDLVGQRDGALECSNPAAYAVRQGSRRENTAPLSNRSE